MCTRISLRVDRCAKLGDSEFLSLSFVFRGKGKIDRQTNERRASEETDWSRMRRSDDVQMQCKMFNHR